MYNYFFIEEVHKDNKDLLDLLRPLMMLCIGEVGIESNIEAIQKNLATKFRLHVPQNTIRTVLSRLEEKGLIVSEGSKYSKLLIPGNKNISNSIRIHKFAPIIISVIEDGLLAIDIKGLRDYLKKNQNIDLELELLQWLMDRLVESQYIGKTGTIYILTREGDNYYQNTLKVLNKIDIPVNQLLSNVKLYLNKELKSQFDDLRIANILVSFIHKNIEPLANFLATPDREIELKYDINIEEEHALCKYVKEEVRGGKNDILYGVMKDLILGSTVLAFYNSDGIALKDDKFKELDIFLDTNILFYLLGYSFEEFTIPTKELFNLMVSKGFRLNIFDFTLEEAKRVLSNCMGKFDKVYIPGAKINSICYYLRSRYDTVSQIQVLANHLEEDLKNFNISVNKTDIDLYKIKIDKERRESISKYKSDQRPISQTHDIISVDQIIQLRGKTVSNIKDSKVLFLTADQKLFDYNFIEMHHKEHQTIPEVFVDRLLTNILWLVDPSRQVSLETLVATCSRDVYINRKSWERLYDRLQHLHESSKITREDIISIVYMESLNEFFKNYNTDRELDEHIQEELKNSKNTRDKLLIDLQEKNKKIDKMTSNMIELTADLKDTQKEGFERLARNKKLQIENERKKQQNLNKKCINILSLIIILFYAVPLVFTYIYDPDYFFACGVVLGFITVVTPFVAKISMGPKNLKYYWNKCDIKLYNFLNKGDIGLIISYGKVEEKNDGKEIIKEEYIEIENTSRYTQRLEALFIYLASTPLYTFAGDTYLGPDQIQKVHFCKGETSPGHIYTEVQEKIWGRYGIHLTLRDGNDRIIDSIEADIINLNM